MDPEFSSAFGGRPQPFPVPRVPLLFLTMNNNEGDRSVDAHPPLVSNGSTDGMDSAEMVQQIQQGEGEHVRKEAAKRQESLPEELEELVEGDQTTAADISSDQGCTKNDGGTAETIKTHDRDHKVETVNVIATKGLNLGSLDKPPLTAPSSFQPSQTPMPTTASRLGEVQLHSPSDIMGTPFATDSSRFEYPFPLTSASAPDFGTTTSPIAFSTNSFPALSPESVFSSLTTSDQKSLSPSSPPPIPPPPVASSYASSNTSPNINEKVAHHPKLKVTVAPVPPNVAKKRHRWSISFMTRRNSGPVNGSAELALEDARTPPAVSSIAESPLELGTPGPSGTGRKDGLLRKLTRRRSERNSSRSTTIPQ